ncbi:hypothetical protein D3C86_1608720 [compost metagenome]
MAAKLVDAGFERQARARGILLEDHGQRAVVQRVPCLVVLELGLEDPRAVQQVFVLFGSEIAELEVMLDRGWAHKTKKAARSGHATRKPELAVPEGRSVSRSRLSRRLRNVIARIIRDYFSFGEPGQTRPHAPADSFPTGFAPMRRSYIRYNTG